MQEQTRKGSLLEAVTGTAVGFVLSWATWLYVVPPLFGIDTNPTRGFAITTLFTVLSIARSYLWRRLFVTIRSKRNG